MHILQEVLSKQEEEAKRLTGLIGQERAKDIADANSGLLRAQHTMASLQEEVCVLHAPCPAHHTLSSKPTARVKAVTCMLERGSSVI